MNDLLKANLQEWSVVRKGSSSFRRMICFEKIIRKIKVSLWKRYGRQLRRFILFHSGLITLRFHNGKTGIISMPLGFSNVSLSPRANLIFIFGGQDISTNPKNHKLCSEIELCKSHWFRNRSSGKAGADRCGDPLHEILKILDAGAIVYRMHELVFRKYGIVETSKPRNFETKQLWHRESLKPRN